jgi:hypothetical protein
VIRIASLPVLQCGAGKNDAISITQELKKIYKGLIVRIFLD